MHSFKHRVFSTIIFNNFKKLLKLKETMSLIIIGIKEMNYYIKY